MALCAVMTGVIVTNLGLPVWVGVIGGIATGVLMGLVNGVNITFLRLPPFIATLAMMMIAGGLALVISNVAPIYFSTSAPDFKKIALGVIIPGIPNAVLITAALAIVAWLVLSKTLLGRYTFAIGSNEEATRLSGVNTRRWTILIYMFAGAFTGIAGIVIAARLDSAQPQIGTGYELQAIAAVIIGGTSLLGGRGSILGTVIGALIMSVLVNGLRIMSIQPEWQNIVVGVVVLLAVFLDSLRNRQRT
jgi:ribose transport system permease protein